jgi:glucose-1-phosphate adenylyltransferase
MKRMMGLICTNYTDGDFGMLTEERPIASIPFGGRYRLVDFPLSNLVNSGINTVGLITPYMYRSLMDHVGNGKAWSLSRKVGGMFILAGTSYGVKNAHGKFLLRDLIYNRACLERTRRELVVVTASNKIYNLDFRDVAERHEQTGAVVTLLYKRVPDGAAIHDLALDCDNRGRVTSLHPTGPGPTTQFMDAMVIDRDLLLKLTEWYFATDYLDLMDIIQENLDKLRVYGYEFDGYVKSIDNAADYMAASMDLLTPQVMQELFSPQRPINTKVQDAPPAKYFPTAKVRNSMVATGCMVKGTVENSILFRGCTVEEGATVRNSVIMPSGIISKGTLVENVICDKQVHIGEEVRLFGTALKPLIVTRKQYS